jgi:NADH-quinone oxidoreductase subunit L
MVMTGNTLIGLIPILPLLGFIILILTGRILTERVASWIGCGTILVSFIVSVVLFNSIRTTGHEEFQYFNWISVDTFKVPFSLMVDPLTSLMMLVITGVGFLIHVYSIGYMHGDAGYNRFFAYLNLFVFFMLLLVMGSNYLILFIGWEGVGLSSYLLIGFWYKNTEYNNAAKKAFVMNRIGDLGLIIGMILIFIHYGTLQIAEVNASALQNSVTSPNPDLMTWITLCLFIGAIGKSAQIPLHTWLPDAMAGPTPVSALIHAATMVTAGVYLIARNNILFSLSPFTSQVVMIIGVASSLMAALIALKQNDIKKVLAYSTVSQLGLMFVAVGNHAYTSGLFHMMTHAFFKALLFLGAGSVIHALHGEQDIRNMGGLRKLLPITSITFLIGALAISGIPPFSGFFSKDEILMNLFATNKFIWILASLSSMLTAFYMFRLVFLTFWGKIRKPVDHIHESPWTITIPLVLLAGLATFGGFLNFPTLFGGEEKLHEFLLPVFSSSSRILVPSELTHREELITMGLAILLAIAAIGLAYYYFISKIDFNKLLASPRGFIQKTLSQKFYVDEIYDAVVTQPLQKVSGFLYKIIDVKWIDGIVNDYGFVIRESSSKFRFIQSGFITQYILSMIIGIIGVLIASKFFSA